MTSAPSKQLKNGVKRRLAASVIVVVRLAVLVDVVAIAAGIAIILTPVDGRTEHAAEDRAGDGAFARAYARNDLAGDRAADRTDRRASCDIRAGAALP